MIEVLIGNIKGPQGEAGPQGDRGLQGIQGPQGPMPPLINNGTTTQAGVAALDARYGKSLKDEIDQINTKGTVQIVNDFVTMSPGFTAMTDTRMARVGNLVELQVVVKSDVILGTQGNDVTIGVLTKNKPIFGINSNSLFSIRGEWDAQDIGYGFIGMGGHLIVRNTNGTAGQYIKLRAVYITN